MRLSDCPHCKKQLGMWRKIFVFNEKYRAECPFCHKKILRHGRGWIGAVFLIAIVITDIIGRKYDAIWITYFATIPAIIFGALHIIFTPLVSGEKNEK